MYPWEELKASREIPTSILSWTASAVYCSDTNMDCGNCLNYAIMGNACQMPRVIERLKAANVQGFNTMRKSAHIDTSITELRNPYLRKIQREQEEQPSMAACV